MSETLTHPWLSLTPNDIAIERQQCEAEGKELAPLVSEFQRLCQLDLRAPTHQRAAEAFLDKTASLPIRGDYSYDEPSDLDGIRATRGKALALPEEHLTAAKLEDKISGAWLGRVCGCLLGKPVEGWRRPKMWGYLKDSGRWPLSAYFSIAVPETVQQKYDLQPHAAFIENVQFMPEDDDINYTVVGLALMKHKGSDFTPADVARFWLSNIPILHTCTAERVAYRNLCLLIPPPQSASYRNPYREWIGAQIRADFFGYVAPGEPELAAEFAWRDACVSHVKNGIYGEMWVAAMLAAAFVSDDIPAIMQSGLAQIPQRSRLHESVRQVMTWHAEGISYDEAVDRLHGRWDENQPHDWCHVISNAMVVAIGLLWGELDFELSICRAVQACFDTDCNGATVGSILGAILGAKGLPRKWTDPIHDTLHTGVAGYHVTAISRLAQDTLAVIDAVREKTAGSMSFTFCWGVAGLV